MGVLIGTVEKAVVEVENFAKNKIHATWDDWFHEVALAKGISLSWKNAIKTHVKEIGCFKDPAKWLEGLLHYGIK